MTPPTDDELATEAEDNLRAKLRLLRTALRDVSRACERDGIYHDEMKDLEEQLEAIVLATDAALMQKRNST